jgi:hypothetical protein
MSICCLTNEGALIGLGSKNDDMKEINKTKQ